MALFSKNKKGDDNQEELKVQDEVVEEESSSAGSSVFSGIGGVGTHKILRGFYISEKASMGGAMNQYTFEVFNKANKSQVRKEVSKLFNVKIKSVKILNMPEKRRDFGRHPGSRSGFKKAIVVLEEGYTIGQAKP